ncbi:hypothetical protein QR680_003394 [Steinernema hermaphroditum]|uniref:Apple domain-containing protein n=1 Tax=Steinernema hermaphroditum TaxID=289476 RepID=A0AA39H6S2_9BILA|nr:hypothetical protein QR680_003394 [Steinernema hermaphroditum]
MDPSEPGSITDLPIDEAVMYSAVKFCIHDPETAPNKRWTFEKFYGRDVDQKKYILDLIEKTTLDECLSACHNHEHCYATLYSEKTHLCRLSSITLQNVQVPGQYFKFVDDTDLYEINGVKRSVDRSRCTFMRLNQAGITDVFDAKIGVVNDATTCERLCTLWSSGFCRSFTFDKEKKVCYLSHVTSRLLGRDPFAMGNKNITMGDLDDCVQYQLKCRATDLIVRGSAIKMFKGKVQMKKGSSVLCQNEIGGSFDFETAIPYGECGVEKKMDTDMMFSGTIMVKEGSTDLITIKDKVIQVNCRMHQDVELVNHRSLTFHLEVNNGNATAGPTGHDDPSNPYIISKFKVPERQTGPKYRLEVFRASGQLADFVSAGDHGYLLVTVNKNDEETLADFVVLNLVAKDKSSGQQFRLLDEDGCPINGTVTTFERLNHHQLKMSMKFEGFRDQAEVVYQAIIKPCGRTCHPHCIEDLYIRNNYTKSQGRPRRSIVSISSSRYFDLSEDLYAVKSRERVTIMSKAKDEVRIDLVMII